MDDYIFDKFINGATANHRDPHFRTEPVMFDQQYGDYLAISVICKLGDLSVSKTVLKNDITRINMQPKKFGALIRRMLWEQVTEEWAKDIVQHL